MRTDPKVPNEKSLDYVGRVNRAIDSIVRDLERPVRLEAVAKAAGFSPFHFHRIFKSLIGETLNQFVKRLRLERALSMMARGRPRSLTDIALACGFSSSSDFSRSFRQRYGVPPRDFDIETLRAQRRADVESTITDPAACHRLESLPANTNPDGFEVRLKKLPARTVAYVRALDPYRSDGVARAIARLLAWAEARGLADGQWLGYMWDDPEVVALEDCRYDAGLEVESMQPEGDIGRFDFPAMLVAEIEMRGPIDMEVRAINWLFGTWLPQSPYVPADQPNFEAWIGRPFQHGDQHFELLLQVPVVRG